MKLKFEKLLLWLIPVIVFSMLADAITTHLMHALMSKPERFFDSSVWSFFFLNTQMSAGELLTTLGVVKSTSQLLVNLAVGIWLLRQHKPAGMKILWFFGGLTLQYWALAFYFLLEIYDQIKSRVPESTADIP